MELTISKTNLAYMIDLCKSATDSRASHPSARSILFTSQEGRLEAFATSVALSIVTSREAKIVKPGAIVLNADRFRVMVKQMPDGGTLKLKTDDKHKALLTCAGSKLRYQLSGTSEDDFPGAPALPENAKVFVFGGNVLADALTRVRDGMGDPGRPELWGITIDTSRSNLTATTLHGHKMFQLQQNREFDHDAGSFFLAEPGVAPVLALCGEQDAKVKFIGSDQKVFVVSGPTTMTVACPGGPVPDWQERLRALMVDRIVCRVDVDILLQAVRSVVVAAPTVNREKQAPALQIEVQNGSMTLNLVNTSDSVDAENTIDVDATDETMKIELEPAYLVQALEAAKGGLAEFRYDGGGINSPLLLVSEDGAKPGADANTNDTGVGKVIFSAFLALRG